MIIICMYAIYIIIYMYAARVNCNNISEEKGDPNG
jgi:hypothetical protein